MANDTKAAKPKPTDFSPSALSRRSAGNVAAGRKPQDYCEHAEEGWHYRGFDPRGRSQLELEAKRADYVRRGFQPVTGPMGAELWAGKAPRREHFPRRPELEIWRTTDEVMADNKRRREQRSAKSEMWLTLQSCRTKRRGAYLPDFARGMADPASIDGLKL